MSVVAVVAVVAIAISPLAALALAACAFLLFAMSGYQQRSLSSAEGASDGATPSEEESKNENSLPAPSEDELSSSEGASSSSEDKSSSSVVPDKFSENTVADFNGNEISWQISDEDFLNKDSLTYAQLKDILDNCSNERLHNNDAILNAIWNRCHNFKHAELIFDESWRHSSFEQKLHNTVISVDGMGINPKVILATLKWESGYDSVRPSNPFGNLGTRRDTFEGELDASINRYLLFYFYGSYTQQYEPDYFEIPYGDTSLKPANAAMFARTQYHTKGSGETDEEYVAAIQKWHNTISENLFP